MTVAGLRSVSKRSWFRNRTLSPAFDLARLAFASLIRSGLISMPTPRAPYFSAAVIGMRPSPEPRSETTSAAGTGAISSIPSATFWGVGRRAAGAGAEIVDDVGGGDVRHLEHHLDDILRRRNVPDIGRLQPLQRG